MRDRDHAYGDVFVRRVRAMGIRDRPTAARSPWQNGYCERAIGSIRRDCLDHIIVFGEQHLRHLLRCYASYYNQSRTHLSLNKDAPARRAVHAVRVHRSKAISWRPTPSICPDLISDRDRLCLIIPGYMHPPRMCLPAPSNMNSPPLGTRINAWAGVISPPPRSRRDRLRRSNVT